MYRSDAHLAYSDATGCMYKQGMIRERLEQSKLLKCTMYSRETTFHSTFFVIVLFSKN